ncbi:hypothetical protein KDH_14080 [Dictyobacter sp. S3.2.2.5]|uniref:Uncharacterized protein n=1 Tax=Dictyobacter halimunensis TaxID=3026934 RepID=A0ABQ6FK00_9CHLR|nr:hypothetical protein KDH_14080 [Dictyobacter sp. S3.2.2.5]
MKTGNHVFLPISSWNLPNVIVSIHNPLNNGAHIDLGTTGAVCPFSDMCVAYSDLYPLT